MFIFQILFSECPVLVVIYMIKLCKHQVKLLLVCHKLCKLHLKSSLVCHSRYLYVNSVIEENLSILRPVMKLSITPA